MKISRVFALAMAGIMLVLALASCGAVAEPITVTVKITPDINDPQSTILDLAVELQSNEPTVLDAFIEGCTIAEFDFVLDAAGESVVDIDQYKDYTDTETNTTYYWYYTVNGVEPEIGKAYDNVVADGDVIEYIYTSFVPEAE